MKFARRWRLPFSVVGRTSDSARRSSARETAGRRRPCHGVLARLSPVVIGMAACLPDVGGRAGLAADDVPAALPPSVPAFQAQELSIGEPISLPTAAPLPPASLPPSPPAAMPSTSQATAPVAAAAAGSGWLGIAVDDTLLTGRLVVVEVAPDSPAAKAGVRQQDVLLAINGTQLRTADEMAAALAAIAPGQIVKTAIGRDNKVEDIAMTAAQRPTDAMTRNWQSAGGAAAAPPRPAPAAADAPRANVTPPLAALEPRPPAVSAPPPVSAPTPFQPTPPPVTVPPTAATATPSLPLARSMPPAPLAASVPAAAPMAGHLQTGGRVALGVRTVPVDPAVQSRFQLADSQGAFVIGVVHDLPAAKAGVPPGSVIVALDQQPVRSPQELTRLVTHGPVGTPVTLRYILPGGQSRQADVILQSLDQPLERALVGGETESRTAAPPALEPAPQTARRVSPTTSLQPADTGPLTRLEEMLRRMTTRLEQIDRRLERLESGQR